MSDEKKILTAADIDAAQDCTVEPVDVPEWGGTIYMRELSAAEGVGLLGEIENLPKDHKREMLYMILARTICDAAGKPLYADAQAAEASLSRRKAAVLTRLQMHALKLQDWKIETPGDKGDSPGKAD